ncbi:acyltransferase [Terrimonas sp. NA20]|uniref:Acyltransferase n=1 Tax=Terrimonas ginsenosidimutans TaxID=2908004 RepID=A0ABS9KNX7_9BACT|nr:acyltransferase [Terrimonas ginsenosidimutans]MCG2613980.1 acyltransferase [Terrimonas ginsenosidimutans]
MKYVKQIDALRAIAACMVIFNHWMPQRYFLSRIGFAAFGVEIFFVLSGFLITWILLENKKTLDAGVQSAGSIFKNFYIRRSLRIFPIYYMVVILLALLAFTGMPGLNFNAAYFFTYTTNFYFFNIKTLEGLGGHLWSLAVEEQFYLIWPAALLFIRGRYSVVIIIAFTMIGVISDIALRNVDYGFLITLTCFHLFGAGAFLAWLKVNNVKAIKKLYTVLKVAAPLALMYYVSIWMSLLPLFGVTLRILDGIMALFVLTHLIYRDDQGRTPAMGFIWNNRYLIEMGKISYGIYLYHPFVKVLLYKVFSLLNIELSAYMPYYIADFLFLLICFAALLAVSRLSWIIIEKPLLNLKKYFTYHQTPAPGYLAAEAIIPEQK